VIQSIVPSGYILKSGLELAGKDKKGITHSQF
jgi:hypothetical protein